MDTLKPIGFIVCSSKDGLPVSTGNKSMGGMTRKVYLKEGTAKACATRMKATRGCTGAEFYVQPVFVKEAS